MDAEKLQTYQKYIQILGLADSPARPTLASDALQKRAQDIQIDLKEWEDLKATFQAYSTRGKNYFEASNYQDAIEEFEIALSLNPHEEKTLLGLAQSHANRWTSQRRSTDKQKAIDYAERVLRGKPEDKQAVRIITMLKNAPFQPWISYKMWWLMGRWALTLAILGGVYWFYAANKEAIHGYFSKLTEKSTTTLPAEAGVDFEKIHFAAGGYDLNAQAKRQLNKLASYLRKNQDIKGELACHTDNSGNSTFNLQISEARAKIVYDYLLQKGVSSSQISYKGYGDLHPLEPNDSETNREKNRRVEFIMHKK